MTIKFDPWGLIPDSTNLQNRLKSASDAKLTPLEIDMNKKTARFSGDNGIYDTGLERCSCTDFIRHNSNGKKLPCKHILRLAMECSLIDISFRTDPSKVKTPVKKTEYDPLPVAVSALESMPECLDLMNRVITEHSKGLSLYVPDFSYPPIAFMLDNELIRKTPDGNVDVGDNVRNCYKRLRCYLGYRLFHKSNLIYTDDKGELREADKQLSDVDEKGVADLLKQYDPFYREQIPDPNQATHGSFTFKYEIK